MPDIIITPSSGLIDFFPVSTRVGRIEGSGNTINVLNPSGFVAVSGSGLSINTSSPNATLHAYSATSGATLLNIEGTNGSLFSVIDNLSGTLMSVNNNAGLPVFEVFSDDRVVAGRFGQNDFIMTSGGNVGIGTGVPSSKFHVVGSVLFSSGLSVSGLITSNSGNFINSLSVNGTGVWHSGNFDSSNIVRATGTQTISGVKTFADGLKVVGNAVISSQIELGVSQDAVVLFGKTSYDLGINSVSYSYNDGGTNYINTRELLIGKGAISPGTNEQLLFAGNSGIGVVHYYDNGGGVSSNRLIFDVPQATTLASANTTLRTTTADGTNIVLNLPSTSGTLALLANINTTQITGVLSVSKGGTNTSTYSNGQLLIGSGTSLVANTLTQNNGITITNGSGTIGIAVDSTVVRTTGDQSINGLKSFSSIVSFNNNAEFGTGFQTAVSLGDSIGPGGSGAGLMDNTIPLAAEYWLGSENIIHYGYGGGTLSSPRIAVLESNGNVGIGTSSPSSKLQVSGLITANSGNFTSTLQLNGSGVGLYDTSVFNLGTISGSNAINCGQDRQIQNLTLNGVATTFTTGTGWPSSSSAARETTLNIFSSGNTSITWTIVNDWYRQPDSPLPSGRHIVLLRSVGSGTMQGHYIGNKTN